MKVKNISNSMLEIEQIKMLQLILYLLITNLVSFDFIARIPSSNLILMLISVKVSKPFTLADASALAIRRVPCTCFPRGSIMPACRTICKFVYLYG